jgi:hexosaminidase
MLQRIAGPATPQEFAALRTLADVLEPVKDYTRGETTSYTAITTTPLNHIVDAVPPESDVARRFDEKVSAFVGGSCRDANAAAQLRAQLTKWRGNDASLQSLAQRASLVKEVAPSSQDLSLVATIGLTALDAIASATPLSDDAKAQSTAAITAASKGKAQLLLIPAGTIQKLVDAAAKTGACSAKT